MFSFTQKNGRKQRKKTPWLAALLWVVGALLCAGCSPAEVRELEGHIQEQVASSNVGTVTGLLAADVCGGPQAELVALAGGKLQLYSRGPQSGLSLIYGEKAPQATGWFRSRILTADFDRDGKAEVVLARNGALSVLFETKKTFKQFLVENHATVYEMAAGRFLSGSSPGLAVRDQDGVSVYRVDVLSRSLKKLYRFEIPGRRDCASGQLAVLPAGNGRATLLMASAGGKVRFFREGSESGEITLGQGDLREIQVVRKKSKEGPLVLAVKEGQLELYRWNGGEPESIWSLQRGRNHLSYPVDLDNDGSDELVLLDPSLETGVSRGNVRVYTLAGGQPELLWDSGEVGARQAAFGDLNGDGLKEIVAVSDAGLRCPDTRKGGILIFAASPGRKPSAWSEVWRSPVYEEGEFVFTTADLDRDGVNELYTGNSANCDNTGTLRSLTTRPLK